MRAYYRIAPRLGVSVPWWAALIVWMLWLGVAVAIAAVFAAGWLLYQAGRGARYGWGRWMVWRAYHPPQL